MLRVTYVNIVQFTLSVGNAFLWSKRAPFVPSVGQLCHQVSAPSLHQTPKMSNIPFEILSLFVEELGLQSLEYWRDTKTRAALQNCTLVCSYLRPQAQRYLFDHITIYDRHGEKLLRMLEANPILAFHIHSFTVEVNADTQLGWCDPLVRMEPIIQSTRSLCRLTLSGARPVRDAVQSPSFTDL